MTRRSDLPPAWTGERWRGAVDDLLALYQFSAARQVLDQVGASEHARTLAALGESLVTLDLHDARLRTVVHGVSADVSVRITEVAWPARREATVRGPLSDLVPTYRLLLEVMHIHTLRGEWSSVLAVLHLMAEYLPLLAWSSRTEDAGDPITLAERVTAPGTAWHTDVCPLNRAERGAFESLHAHGDWDEYLHNRHSRVASALAVCGGVPEPVLSGSSARACRNQCAVMDGVTGVAWRMTLVRRFRDSALLQLRHDAPVGHFFAVPGAREISAAWGATWHGLVADGPETPAGENPATGMRHEDWDQGVAALLGLVAGQSQPLAPATLVADVADHIRLEIR